MRQILLHGLSGLLILFYLLGTGPTCQAQVDQLMAAAPIGVAAVVPLAAPDPGYSSKGPGAYQLVSGQWQQASIALTNSGLTVGKGAQARSFGLEQVRQVVVQADTFVVVSNAKFPDANTVSAAPTLAQRKWRRPQVELLEYHSASGVLPLLRFPDGRAVVLPRKRKEFCANMLLLVSAHPGLDNQFAEFSPDAGYARQILEEYLRLKPAGFSSAQIDQIMAAVSNEPVRAASLSVPDPGYSSKGAGAYQLVSGQWQQASITLTNAGLTVGKGAQARSFRLEQVRQVVVRTDTFVVVSNAKFSDDDDPVTVPVLGRRVWRRPQVELFDYYSAEGILPLLRFPDGKAVVLPRKGRNFRAAALKLVGDHPGLVRQLTDGYYDVSYMRDVLEQYLLLKPSGFQAATDSSLPQTGAAK